jgi:RNA polymerase sigma-70 factor (ECF subfamily)
MSHEPNASAASPAPAADWGDLLARVRAGDDDAARVVVERLHGHVRKIVLAHLPRREEPEDLMQEAFLRMFDRLDQYRGAVAFENWVARITVHVCIDRLRRQRARPEWRWADLSEEQQALVEATAATEADPGPSAPENARELLDQLLASLKPEEQMILRWFDLEQKTIAEVCALTGWNSGVVRIRVFRARRKLRALYRKLEHSKP